MELAAGAGVAAAAAAGGAAYLRSRRGPASGKEGTTKWQWRAAAVKERRALCICCSYPGTQWALPGCVPDQEAMVKTLIRNSYAVTFLADHTPAWGQPKPSAPSNRRNILAELEALCRWLHAAPGRQGWVSYSGHGTQTADRGGDEADGLDEAMVPCDFKMAGLLTDDKLRTTIRFGEGSSLMFFFDCCHSGTILDLPYTLRHTLSGPEYPIETEAGAVFCISASKDDQSAYETAEGGVCTRAFLGAYTPSVSPAATLRLMRRYAERKGMPQTIMMASNRPFTEADASFVEAEPEGGGGFCAAFHRCQNRLGCSKGRSKAGDFGGENPAARSLELNRGEASGRGPKLHPSCPDPLSTTKGRAYVAARRAKLAAPPP